MDEFLRVALTGDLQAYMNAEKLAAKKATTAGVRRTGTDTKSALRGATRQAGLAKHSYHKTTKRAKGGLIKAWQVNHYPEKIKGGGSINAAAYVFSKADRLHGIFSEGGTAKANKKWMLIPTKAAIKKGFNLNGGRRKGEHNWASVKAATEYYGEENLVILPRGDLLVIAYKNAKKNGDKRRSKLRKGQMPTALFFGVKRVKIPKLLNLNRIYKKHGDKLADNILSAWKRFEGQKNR